MAFQQVTRLHKQAGWTLAVHIRRLLALLVRGSTLQWMIAGGLGVALGIYVLGVSSLQTEWVYLSIPLVLCFFIVLIVGNVRKLLLAVIILDIPFQFDVYLFYREEVANLGAIGGLNISVATLGLVILYTLWLVELLSKVDSFPRSLLRSNALLVAYLIIVVLSVTVAYDVNLAIFDIFLLLQTFLLFFYIVGTVRTRQDLLYILMVLLTGLILESLVMIGLRLIGHNVTIANITARIDGGVRVGGTIGSPNSAASYLTLLLAPAFSLLITRLNLRYKLLAVFAFGLGGVALVLTLSRGGWLAFVLSIAILNVLAWYRGWLRPIIPLVMVTVAVLAYFLFQDAFITRLFDDDSGSAYSRVPLMQIAFRMTQEHPLLGVGTNNYAFVLNQYVTPDVSREWLYVVHNKYLLIWAETGPVGLITYIWFLLATLFRGWQGWRLHDRVLSPLALGFAVAIVGQMVHMFVDVFNGRVQVQMLWLIAGLITTISRMDPLIADSAAKYDGSNVL